MKVINARQFSLDNWLEVVLVTPDLIFPNNCFPNEPCKTEYLDRVKGLSEKNVKDLLRVLLPRTGVLGTDRRQFSTIYAKQKEEVSHLIESHEYYRRNLQMQNDVWQGLSWILDLLPHSPKLAINVLSAYLVAHFQHMTDEQIFGNSDCADIIRARYYDMTHPQTILLDVDPEEFEWLIRHLYDLLGYETKLTARSNDRGIDVEARKRKTGKREYLLIQCKRSRRNIGSPYVRDLLGIVSSEKATKGVMVSTSEFTKEAKRFADLNPSLELIGYSDLNKLLNIHLGTRWPYQMDGIFTQARKDQNRSYSA